MNTVLPPDKGGSSQDIISSLEILVSPVSQPAGGLAALSGSVRRELTEEELLRSLSTLRGFVDSVRGFVAYVDREQRYQLVNQHYLDWFGKPDSHFLGRRLNEVHRPATYATMWPQMQECLAGRKVQRETTMVGRDGNTYFFDVQHVPRLAPDGAVLGFFVLVFDITVRKIAEAEQRRLLAKVFHADDEARRHIARELHDTTGQQLAAIKLNLAHLRKQSWPAGGEAERVIAESLALAESAMQEIRTLTFLLHPPLLDELGLPAALEDYARGFSRRSGIAVTVRSQNYSREIPREIEVVLFRVVQESLTNILRHSGSPTALIRLELDAEQIRLEIQDAGRGFPAGIRPHGVGIAGMRERLRVLGGGLEVESDSGGVTVLASVSIQREQG